MDRVMMMEKCVGCICIFAGSIGVANAIKQQIQTRFRMVKEYASILMKMQHLLLLEYMPLDQVLQELFEITQREWKVLFGDCIEQIRKSEEKSFPEIWKAAFEKMQQKVGLKREEEKLLGGFCHAVLVPDRDQVRVELEYLMKEQECMEKELLQKKKEVEKLSTVVGVAIGAVSILVLI